MTAETADTVAAPLAADGDAAAVTYAPDPADRIEPAPPARDRTFEIALAIVAVIYVALLSASVHLGVAPDADRRGQVEGPPSITVELVELPDEKATSKQSQQGAETPPQPAAPPVPPSPPAPEQPPESATEQPPPKPPEPEKQQEPEKPVDKVEPETKPPPAAEKAEATPEPAEQAAAEQKTEDPADKAIDFSDADLTLDKEAREFEQQIAALNRRRATERAARRQTLAKQSQTRVLGQAATGETSAYSKSVIAALFKTKPLVYSKRGEAVVGFEITRNGTLRFVSLVKSSGDRDMDTMALNAIRRAKFERPAPDTPERDLTYVITYVFD